MLFNILNQFNIFNDDIINVYPYGSRVYKTNDINSDYDFIAIINKNINQESINIDNYNISLYTFDSFIDKLNLHDVAMLECIFLPKELNIKYSRDIDFVLDKEQLRCSISGKASHSFVKAKKKFQIEKDKNIYIAKKSLFHSLRIIDFGMQIAKYNSIVNYQSSNYLWEEIKNNKSDNWKDYKLIYQPIYNNLMTEFRKIAPKKEI